MFQKKKNNERTVEKKPFVIPQLPKRAIDLIRKKDEYNPSQFVSPIFGKSVMDKTVVLGFKSDGDIRKKYNAFRDEKLPIEGEEEYREFESVLISNKTRAEIFPGAQVVEPTINMKSEAKEAPQAMKISIVKDLHEVNHDRVSERNYSDPVYGNVNKPEEKIEIKKPTPKQESLFSYGNDTFGDVSFDKFSFPKYEEPVYTHSRFNETVSDDTNSEPEHFIDETPVVEEEVTYQEEISFGTAKPYHEEEGFVRSGDFGIRIDEEKHEQNERPSLYEESVSPYEVNKEQSYEEEKPVYTHSVRTDKYENYHLPPVSLLKKTPFDKNERPEWIQDQIDIINNTLVQFDIEGSVSSFTKGPTVTRYEIKLNPGVHVKKISNISDNIKMALAAKVIRIEAPIPGKPNVGIEVPNKVAESVSFGNIVDTDEFMNSKDPLKVAVGLNIDGDTVYNDIAKMPHGLIAGTTGSGKSVCVNGFLISLLLKNSPKDLKLMLIDPKVVEFATYNDIPHLVTPVINDPKVASLGLKWCVDEMERRYQLIAQARAKDIVSYNQKVAQNPGMEHMPYMVVVIDELADLMMVASNDVEDAIKRLTAKSRACGIHLLVATQRPTTDVVKGTIKANIPTRFAFRVSSIPDSVTILNQMGAESLLGRGDMLIKESDNNYRVQGAFVSGDEIDAVTDFIRNQAQPDYLFEHSNLLQSDNTSAGGDTGDELFPMVAKYVVECGSTSINRIQKEYNVGFNRAQKLFELLKDRGIIASVSNGSKGNTALVTPRELDEMLRRN